MIVHQHRMDVEACAACQRYARTETLLSSTSPETAEALLLGAGGGMPTVVREVQAVCGDKVLRGVELTLCRCPLCSREWVRPTAVIATDKHEEHRVKPTPYGVDPSGSSQLKAGAAAENAPPKAA